MTLKNTNRLRANAFIAADPPRVRAVPVGALLALATLVLLIPVGIAPIPPLTDYPNHLARLWLLSGGVTLPGVREIYAVRWDTLTNIVIDVMGATIGKVTSFEFAGRLSVALATVLPPLGAALLWRTIHGRWHWWTLAFGLLAWGHSLLSGFLNFQIGIGIALLAAAWDGSIARQSGLGRFLLRGLVIAVLFFCHPFAILFYLFLLGGLAWGPNWRPSWRALLRSAGQVLASALVMGAIFFVLTASLPGTQEHAGIDTVAQAFRTGIWQFERDPRGKLISALLGFRSYDFASDMICGTAFVLPVVIAAAMGRLRLHAGMLIATVLLAACYFAFPNGLMGAYWVDARFAIMAPFAFVLATQPQVARPLAAACTALLLATALGRTAMVAEVWRERQTDMAAIARAYAAIPEGAKVLPLAHWPADWSAAPRGRFLDIGAATFWHDAALGLPWRHVFVPTIFAARGKQPIQVMPPWDQLSEPNGGQIADMHVLDTPAVLASAEARAPYVSSWRRFDYALVVNADMPDRSGPLAPVAGVTLVANEGFAKVYKIDRE